MTELEVLNELYFMLQEFFSGIAEIGILSIGIQFLNVIFTFCITIYVVLGFIKRKR